MDVNAEELKQESKIRLCQKTLKKSFPCSGIRFFGLMKPTLTCTKLMGREKWRKKGTAHDPKHTTSSVKHGSYSVMAWACMAVHLCLLMIYLLTEVKG